MQPPPTIEELRLERPDLSDAQLLRREGRIRLMQQAMMCGFPRPLQPPPDHPDDPWEQEPELQAWLDEIASR
jgi:hypothetical protein